MGALIAVTGPADVRNTLRGVRWEFVGLAFLSYAVFFLLRGVRWRLLLGPGSAGAGTAALATAAGWLVSTFVPMKAGDVGRAAWMGRRHGKGFAATSGSVALERLLDVAGLAIACTLSLLMLRQRGDLLPTGVNEAVAVAWVLPILGLAGLVALGAVLTPQRRRNALLRFAGRALDQARLLLDRPSLWLPVGALTAAVILTQGMVYAFLVLAFLPHASPALALAGAPLFLLSFVIAITPGHLGTYEAAFVVVFSALGLGGPGLLAVALAVHLLTVSMVSVLGGLSLGGLLAMPGTPAAARPEPGAPRPRGEGAP